MTKQSFLFVAILIFLSCKSSQIDTQNIKFDESLLENWEKTNTSFKDHESSRYNKTQFVGENEQSWNIFISTYPLSSDITSTKQFYDYMDQQESIVSYDFVQYYVNQLDRNGITYILVKNKELSIMTDEVYVYHKGIGYMFSYRSLEFSNDMNTIHPIEMETFDKLIESIIFND